MNRSEQNWTLARSIGLTPSDEGLAPGCHGVVQAARHPTGWFISAWFDPALSPEQLDDFAHFVVVRTFLLLEYGPQRSVWAHIGADVWRADCRALTADPTVVRRG